MAENILQLFADDNKTIKGYPITSAKLVIRENGRSMEDFDKDMVAKQDMLQRETEKSLKNYVDKIPTNIVVSDNTPTERRNFLHILPEELVAPPELMAEEILKKVNNTTSQLADIVQQELPTYAKKTEVNTKAEISYVDTKVGQIVSGSPKDTYENLNALQVAKPTGDTGIFITSDDGHWKYWNGSIWADGGIYQAIKIATKSIEKQHLSSNYNMFDKSKTVNSRRIVGYDTTTLMPTFATVSTHFTFEMEFPQSGYLDVVLNPSINGQCIEFLNENGQVIRNLKPSNIESYLTETNGILYLGGRYKVNISKIRELYPTVKTVMFAFIESYRDTNYIYGEQVSDLSEFKWLKPIVNNIGDFIDICLPKKIYGVVGHEINLYFNNIILCNNLKNYQIDVVLSGDGGGNHYEERWTYTPTISGTFNLTIDVYKDYETKVATATTTVYIANTTTNNGVKKVLVIGDSTVNAGDVTQEMYNLGQSDVMKIELLGTRGTAPNLHEGRNGWTANDYLTLASEGSFINAFYNNGFDFSYYMTQQGYSSVDWVFINLGINDSTECNAYSDSDFEGVLSRFDTMINSIKNYNTNIKIGVYTTIPPAYTQDGFGVTGTGNPQYLQRLKHFKMMKKVVEYYFNKENQNIYVVPTVVNIDTLNNFPTKTIQLNSRNTATKTIINNNVHPATSGYYQIADSYFYFLKNN